MNFGGKSLILIAMICSSALGFVFRGQRVNLLQTTRLFASPKETVEAAIKGNKVMVFSKTYCPYCTTAKEAIGKLSPQFGLIELDNVKEGNDIQQALLDITGQRTVPNIFVNGKHVGGCDNTLAAIASGEFQKMMQ